MEYCDGDCNHCGVIMHPNSRQLTAVLNALYNRFGNEVYVTVQHMCPNMTCCYDCRLDDFCHVEGCRQSRQGGTYGSEWGDSGGCGSGG